MTTVAQRRSRAMVSTHMRTTPAATSRAETSLTGLGNENRARARPEVTAAVPSTPMTCSLSSTFKPDQISRLSPGGGPSAGFRAPGSGLGEGDRLGRWRPDVPGGGADEAVVPGLLHHVRAPSDGATRRKGR